MPSVRSIRSTVPRCRSLSEANRNSSSDATNPNGMSRRMLLRERARGRIRAQTPRMTKTLKRLDPTTLPTAMSDCPPRADSTETTSSGVEVPMATTVSPTMNSGTRNRCASAAAPSVSRLAPARMRPSPTRSKTIFIYLYLIYNCALSEHNQTYLPSGGPFRRQRRRWTYGLRRTRGRRAAARRWK